MKPPRFKVISIPILLWLFRLVFIAIVLFFLSGFLKDCSFFGSKNSPSITEAPWAIQTSSRVYYAKEYSIQSGNPAIKDFWVAGLDGKYIYHAGVKLFPKREYGEVAIIRRVK